MKRTGIRMLSLLLLFLLVHAVSPIIAESISEDFSVEPLYAGSRIIELVLQNGSGSRFLANAFSGGESIAASAERIAENRIVLTLTRPLQAGEEVRLLLQLMEDDRAVWEESSSCEVTDRFSSRLPRLRTRLDQLWPTWKGTWLRLFQEGQVALCAHFDSIPFVAFPDEAPEIMVEESETSARIYLSEPLPEAWHISLASGIPVELTPCEWDDRLGAFTGPAGFDSVYLVSDQESERMSITLVYERAHQFRPSWPIVEWIEPDAENPLAFNCYGFGDPRSFTGGMYAIVGPDAAWYAEYDANHALSNYMNLFTECMYAPDGNLLSGEEPEDYVCPVMIW